MTGTVTVEAYGIKYVVDAPNAWILGTSYEPYMPNTVKLPRDGVFVDVGAHVGKYAFYAAKQALDGLVIAVEPLPQNMANLMAGIKLNNFCNIKTFQVACGAEEKNIQFLRTDASSAWKTTMILPDTIQVRMRTLDSIIEETQVKKVDMIKIDVEQYELEVLKGAIQTLKKFSPRLQVEVWDINQQKRDVHVLLQSFGYHVEEVLFSYVGPVHAPYQDVLFQKKGET